MQGRCNTGLARLVLEDDMTSRVSSSLIPSRFSQDVKIHTDKMSETVKAKLDLKSYLELLSKFYESQAAGGNIL